MGSALTAQCLEALLAKSGQCALLANIMIRTNRMLQAAREGDWDLVTVSEKKRSKLVRECFSSPVSPSNTELFSEALAIMLHMNEELMALLEAAKDDASVRRTDHQFAHEAIGHYLDTKSESV